MNTTADQLVALDAMAAHLATAAANGHEMTVAALDEDGEILSECTRCGAYAGVLWASRMWLADHWGITDRCGEGKY